MYTYAKRNKKVWEERSDISRKIVTLQEIQTFVNQSEDDIRTNIEEEEDLHQFSTENHECIAIICQNGQRACGISVFRKGKITTTQCGKTKNSLSSIIYFVKSTL